MLFLRNKLIYACIMLSLLLFAGTLAAEDEPKPDGYIDIEATQVAIGIGLGWGQGELKFGGLRYPIKVRVLTLIGAGVTVSKITGNVYNLAKVEDIEGNYTLGGAGGTLGKGAAAGKMKNEKGVVIEAWSTKKGVNIGLGGGGLTLQLVK